ncbi:hypothetical protein QBC41DRAFT_381483 [Cercophora samala]|uniref:Uncharacterized protein n=1 Tax=Cercophora samala TaxID=330535 RepID=A0AA39Z2P1_9PEZI|nr:hypothetical protein QBC41DRAFT_381483 [Cercophora samala]
MKMLCEAAMHSAGDKYRNSDKTPRSKTPEADNAVVTSKDTLNCPSSPVYRTRIVSPDEIAKRSWKVVRFGDYDVLDLDSDAEKGFQPKRSQIEGMIRHMRTSDTGRVPVATVKGYKLRRRGSPCSKAFNAAVIMSNSAAFAGDVKKMIRQSGILSDIDGQEFKVVVQDAPLQYGKGNDETVGSELRSVKSATDSERSRRSLDLFRLIRLVGRRNASRPPEGIPEDCESQTGRRLEKKRARN